LIVPRQAAVKTPVPAVTYTPNGIPRQPGFFNPTNPYDTGRHGEKNRELNGGRGGKMEWWDYDRGMPKPGVALGADGLYRGPGGGGGGGGGSSRPLVPGFGYLPMMGRVPPFVLDLARQLVARSSAAPGASPVPAPGPPSAPDYGPGEPGFVAPSAADWVRQPGFYDEGDTVLPGPEEPKHPVPHPESLLALLKIAAAASRPLGHA